MRKIAITLCGALLMALAFVLSPSLRAGAANTACALAQGGASFAAGSGCTIALSSGAALTVASGAAVSGAGSVIITGKVGIPNGSAPAATCTAGEIFLDTDDSVDTNCTTDADNSLCLCVATDSWVKLNNN